MGRTTIVLYTALFTRLTFNHHPFGVLSLDFTIYDYTWAETGTSGFTSFHIRGRTLIPFVYCFHGASLLFGQVACCIYDLVFYTTNHCKNRGNILHMEMNAFGIKGSDGWIEFLTLSVWIAHRWARVKTR
jgi:hypothetical protein